MVVALLDIRCQKCVGRCEYHVPLVLNEEPKANLLSPAPVTCSPNECGTVKGKNETDTVEASLIVSVMTRTKLSAQKRN